MAESVLTTPLEVKTEVSNATPEPPAKRSSKAFNSFQIAQAQFDKVAEYLGLDLATRDLLRYPLREYQFAIPVRMDDGMVKIFRGFRGQGWHSVPPAGDDRYGTRSINVDDMEVCGGGYSAGRGEGWCDL